MKRGNLIFVTGILIICIIVVLSYLFVISRRQVQQDPNNPVFVSPAAELTARLLNISGDVQVRPRDHEWQATIKGQSLLPGTQLRTGEGAKAELLVGKDLHINVTAGTDIRLGDIGPNLARLFVGEGVVLANVKSEQGPRLQIANRNGEAVAETGDGALTVSVDANGELRTAVTKGSATVAANGETVNINAGFYSIAGAGRKPSKPASVPQSLLLKVRWPTIATTSKRHQLISGATSVGARIRVAGQTIWADKQGRFNTIVDLQEGKNRIQLRVTDVVGRESSETSPEIELYTKAPSQKIETSPEMWK